VNVLDNLIYRGELPVMIAAFIDPGKFTRDGASNRQAEYDPPGERSFRTGKPAEPSAAPPPGPR
jgi:hypothetical protein